MIVGIVKIHTNIMILLCVGEMIVWNTEIIHGTISMIVGIVKIQTSIIIVSARKIIVCIMVIILGIM